MREKRKTVLTIAGSDPTGGAGIQQDIKVCQMLGVYCATAITALTVQNRRGVSSLNLTAPDLLAAQIDAVCSTISPDAVKIGMTGSAQTVEVIADAIRKHGLRNIVVDPVASSTAGGDLSDSPLKIWQAMAQLLFPIVDIVTPNRQEAEHIIGRDPYAFSTIQEAAAEFCAVSGAKRTVLKGGHFEGDSIVDVYFESMTGTNEIFFSTRTASDNTHGTGCTLSSAIAANLASGFDYPAAFARAECFTREAIARAAKYEFGLI